MAALDAMHRPCRRARAIGVAVGVALALTAAPGIARAEVERYAVIVGHNEGAPDEQKLRFAENDARRVAELLAEVGGVRSENQILLRGPSAEDMRRALIRTSDRIRAAQKRGRSGMLFVYYSGHGDADSLHLGDSRLALRDLERLVRESGARVRILMIDSCRSGSLTRVKGGKPAPAMVVGNDSASEGTIVLTASAAGEEAQESDELSGSFFTHYLVSGLRGAADTDGDQVITVGEAFRYTRAQTLSASSRTLAGPQHPTFYYDVRGRAELALADLGNDRTRGQLAVPDGATWLILVDGAAGVVGEIVAGSGVRALSLRPGRYRVRGRLREALLEGTVTVSAGATTTVDPSTLVRTPYARLARKGHADPLRGSRGLLLGPAVQSARIEGIGACFGGMAGWISGSTLTISPRLGVCRDGGFANQIVSGHTFELALGLRIARVWDLSKLSLDLGATAGLELLHERFMPVGDGAIPPEAATTASGTLGAGGSVTIPLRKRLSAIAEVTAQAHLFHYEDSATLRFTVRGLVALGVWL